MMIRTTLRHVAEVDSNELVVQEELNARNQELKSNRAKGLKGTVNSYKNSVTKFYDTIVRINATLLRIRS